MYHGGVRNRTAPLLAIAVLLIFHGGYLRGQATAARHNAPWTAQWIAAPDGPQKDQVVLHFRKLIDLSSIPQHFYVDVSADNQFILHVNQHRVGAGPSRGDLTHWRYETYDLAPVLRVGRNVLAATVWNFGTASAIAQMSDRAAFLVHGHGETGRLVDTNESWEGEVERGIRASRPEIHGYYAAEPAIRVDGQTFDWAWDSGNAATGRWAKPILLGRGSPRGETDAPNNWQLMSDPLPAMEMTLVPAGHVVRATGVPLPAGFPEKPFTVPAHTKATLLLDNSKLTTGYPVITAAGAPGSTILLTYTEALVDAAGQKGNRNDIEGKHIEGVTDEFLLGTAELHEFMPLVWRTWRYLQIDIEATDRPVIVQSLRNWFTAYPFTERASFSSDDPSLRDIWDIGRRTAWLDAHDTYMDTPYWERLQYVGDTRIQALISYVVAGDDRLGRQAIEAFNNSRIPDGITQSRYPSSLQQIIPTFSLLWVGMVHDFWLYRGDADFVRAQLPGTRAVLAWYLARQRPDGLVSRLPWWPFVDWGKDFEFGMPPQDDDGGSAVITLQFVEALRDAADLEAAQGDPQLANKYRTAAEHAADGVRNLCWNAEYGLVADTPSQQHYSQHTNILAVWLDVIPQAQQQSVLEKILSTSDAGFFVNTKLPPLTAATYYFRFYLARALEQAGMADQYLQLLGPWRTMMSLGLTTWAESPEPTRSDSHAWSAHPNFDLLTLVAGIHPGAAGFDTVVIEPHLGTLKNVEASMPTPEGNVKVNYRQTPSGVDAGITLPTGLSGKLIWKGHESALHEGKQNVMLR